MHLVQRIWVREVLSDIICEIADGNVLLESNVVIEACENVNTL